MSIIRTQNQEKCRLSVLLTITADGTKLPPFLIFKAKVNGDIEKELSKDINAVNGKCFFFCNNNVGYTEEVMTKWYYSVWNKYLLNGHLFNYYLIMIMKAIYYLIKLIHI